MFPYLCETPTSHLETACGETPIACVTSASLRYLRIRSAIKSLFMFFIINSFLSDNGPFVVYRITDSGGAVNNRIFEDFKTGRGIFFA